MTTSITWYYDPEALNVESHYGSFDSSYLGENEFGPFFIEANYDRSSTFRGKL
jgi:hypothetical protein